MGRTGRATLGTQVPDPAERRRNLRRREGTGTQGTGPSRISVSSLTETGDVRLYKPTEGNLMESQPWSIHGEIIDTCNCEVICPCTMGAAATEGKCLGNVLWAIDTGR